MNALTDRQNGHETISIVDSRNKIIADENLKIIVDKYKKHFDSGYQMCTAGAFDKKELKQIQSVRNNKKEYIEQYLLDFLRISPRDIPIQFTASDKKIKDHQLLLKLKKRPNLALAISVLLQSLKTEDRLNIDEDLTPEVLQIYKKQIDTFLSTILLEQILTYLKKHKQLVLKDDALNFCRDLPSKPEDLQEIQRLMCNNGGPFMQDNIIAQVLILFPHN